MRDGSRIGRAGSLLSGFLLLLATGAHAQAVTPVPKLDLERFAGTWYEVARLPNKPERKCTSDLLEVIALGDKANHLQIVNSCKIKDGYTDARNRNGKTEDKSGDGKLKVGSCWPFMRKHWIIALGPDYAWAVVGTPNHKQLWIFSRTANLAADSFAQAEGVASAQGFAVGKLIVTQGKPR